MQTMSWDEFRLVRAIAESGSLAGAGDLLGLNHSTVFRRLNALEQMLGSRLFERARTGYAPTPAGEEMVALAARMFEEITEFERRVAGATSSRPANCASPPTIPRGASYDADVRGFCRQFPEIKLDVVVDNRALNLSRRDADVAIRATGEPPETLVGRRIATIAWAVYGSKGCDIPTTEVADALIDQTWIGFGDPISTIGPARWMASRIAPSRIFYKLNTVLGLSQAIEAGLGVGFVPCFIGDRIQGW